MLACYSQNGLISTSITWEILRKVDSGAPLTPKAAESESAFESDLQGFHMHVKVWEVLGWSPRFWSSSKIL